MILDFKDAKQFENKLIKQTIKSSLQDIISLDKANYKASKNYINNQRTLYLTRKTFIDKQQKDSFHIDWKNIINQQEFQRNNKIPYIHNIILKLRDNKLIDKECYDLIKQFSEFINISVGTLLHNMRNDPIEKEYIIKGIISFHIFDNMQEEQPIEEYKQQIKEIQKIPKEPKKIIRDTYEVHIMLIETLIDTLYQNRIDVDMQTVNQYKNIIDKLQHVIISTNNITYNLIYKEIITQNRHQLNKLSLEQIQILAEKIINKLQMDL